MQQKRTRCIGVVLLLVGTSSVYAQLPTGVSARQVQQLLADKFNTADRSLTLWDLQPGLGTVMIEYSRRVALAHQAVQVEDWGMAQYQIKEAIEIQEVGETTALVDPGLRCYIENIFSMLFEAEL